MQEVSVTPDGKIREATLSDIDWLSKNLSKTETRNLEDSYGKSPREALEHGFKNSQCSGCLVYRGEPITMFGSIKVSESAGIVWSLSSSKPEDTPIFFVKATKVSLSIMGKNHKLLFNFVDASNSRRIAFLDAVGFEIIFLHPYFGMAKVPYYEFIRVSSSAW